MPGNSASGSVSRWKREQRRSLRVDAVSVYGIVRVLLLGGESECWDEAEKHNGCSFLPRILNAAKHEPLGVFSEWLCSFRALGFIHLTQRMIGVEWGANTSEGTPELGSCFQYDRAQSQS